MIQTGHRLCFSSKALQRSMGIGAITKYALYRYDALGMSLPGAIDYAHTPVPDLLEDFVISQLPGLVARIQLVEYGLISRLRYFAISFQSPLKQTVHANSVVELHGCSTFPAFGAFFHSAREWSGVWI